RTRRARAVQPAAEHRSAQRDQADPETAQGLRARRPGQAEDPSRAARRGRAPRRRANIVAGIERRAIARLRDVSTPRGHREYPPPGARNSLSATLCTCGFVARNALNRLRSPPVWRFDVAACLLILTVA